MKPEILIVDDEPDIRFLLEGVLEDEGYEVHSAANDSEALASFRQHRPFLVIQDIWLENSELDGLALLKTFRREDPLIPVVMISGHGTIETAVASLKEGAYDFVEKPFQADRLLGVISRALEHARLHRENAELRQRAGGEDVLTGKSSQIAAVRSQIEKVAPTNARVLLSGPAGSGKGVAARMIHQKSRRHAQPFVVVNCAILSPERFEEELFGIEGKKGVSLKRGLLEMAHHGTLLLDEVGDMPLETQGKMVRILQMQSFQRVGGHAPVKIDVRVLATTSRSLEEEIAAGRFREDLYYRLAVVPLNIPALGERVEDIPDLAQIFLSGKGGADAAPREIGPEAMAVLQTYSWPGNVRELRNLMERLVILWPDAGREKAISSDLLPDTLRRDGSRVSPLGPEADIMGLPLRAARDIFETQYLQIQLMRFGGNISRTANFVCMERSALHRKLKQLGVNTEDRGTFPQKRSWNPRS